MIIFLNLIRYDICSESDHNAFQHKNNCLSDIGVSDELYRVNRAQKRIESWLYWIIVDIIGIWLYYVKEVRFISLLYVILLVIAINGLIIWFRGMESSAAVKNRITGNTGGTE